MLFQFGKFLQENSPKKGNGVLPRRIVCGSRASGKRCPVPRGVGGDYEHILLADGGARLVSYTEFNVVSHELLFMTVFT